MNKISNEEWLAEQKAEWESQFENGHVYVIERPDKVVKIGKTKAPTKRIRSICLQGGFEANRVFVSSDLRNAAFVERAAHHALSEFRVIGEWFDCSFSTASAVVDSAIDTERKLNGALKIVRLESVKLTHSAEECVEAISKHVSRFIGSTSTHPDFSGAARYALSQELDSLAGALSRAASNVRLAAALAEGQENEQ